MLRHYKDKGNELIGRRGLAAVTAEGPADAEGGVEAVGAVGGEVGGAQRFVVVAEPIHLVLCGAELEVLWQLKANANGTLVGDGGHGRGVDELRDIISKTKFWFEEEIQMAGGGASKGLQFDVAAEKIAGVGSAEGRGTAGARWLRKGAAAEVGFVVGRRDLEIGVAANPVVGEEGAQLVGGLGGGTGLACLHGLGVRLWSKNE